MNEKTRTAYTTSLVKSIERFFILTGQLSFSFPFWHFFPTKDWREFEKTGAFVYKTVKNFIQEAKDKLENQNPNNPHKKTILSRFLERKDNYGLEVDDIVSIMIDLMIAGVDTVSFVCF
jgi:cytochrome P450